MSKRLRCAIYTRKSSEEGLEQNFNSLHAQREACEAYVLSQAGEGWSALKTHYDDGGFSGGTMERPGLKQLMDDIRLGMVDIVVVYKVDRLTRSLADFAKIVELFDRRGVSFVSVTQAFNTTSSMGRLTLNVLLSFAQFEREVTGERIRDKVAASKAKGLRMGGRPPLGYDIKDGRLAVNDAEAKTVRHMFERYLALGSVRMLETELRADGITGKRWINKREEEVGGGFLGRGPLYHLLANPVYVGITRHKEKRHADTHPAIIDWEVWGQVQARLKESRDARPSSPKRGEAAPLEGKLFDDRENPMVPVHTTKGHKRYRYYLSRAKLLGKDQAGSLERISAGLLERFLTERLTSPLLQGWRPASDPATRVHEAIVRVTLGSDQMIVELAPDAIEKGASSQIRLPFHMARRKGGVITGAETTAQNKPKLDRALIRGLALACAWANQLESGAVASVRDLASNNRLCLRYTSKLLPLAYLAPDLTAAIFEGRQPRALTLAALTDQPLPLDWPSQRRLVNSLL